MVTLSRIHATNVKAPERSRQNLSGSRLDRRFQKCHRHNGLEPPNLEGDRTNSPRQWSLVCLGWLSPVLWLPGTPFPTIFAVGCVCVFWNRLRERGYHGFTKHNPSRPSPPGFVYNNPSLPYLTISNEGISPTVHDVLSSNSCNRGHQEDGRPNTTGPRYKSQPNSPANLWLVMASRKFLFFSTKENYGLKQFVVSNRHGYRGSFCMLVGCWSNPWSPSYDNWNGFLLD